MCKKVFLIFITVLLLANIRIIAAQNWTTDEDIEGRVAVLQALNIYNLSSNSDDVYKKEILRDEFVAAVMRMAYPDVSQFYTENGFADVPEDSIFIDEINAAKSIGLVCGVSYGIFAPDKPMALKYGILLIKKILGYEQLPDSSVISKGLCKGVDLYSENLSVESAVNLLYNALEIDKMMYDLNGNYKIKKGVTLLSDNLGIEKRDGIVEANKDTSLYSGQGTGNEKYVVIDGIRYKAPKELHGFLGCEVTFYCRDYDSDEAEIIYFYEKMGNHIVFEADEISGFEANTFSIINNENGKSKKYRISNKSVIIYNGIETTDIKKAVPGYGTVELTDNDGDNVYDVINVNDYESYFVSGILIDEYFIYTQDGGVLKFDEEAAVFVDGQPAGFEAIPIRSVALVKKSEINAKNPLCVIEISTNKISGAAKTVNDDSIIMESGEEYKLNPQINFDAEAGENGTYYIDSYGRAAYFISDAAGAAEHYGFLIDAVYERSSPFLVLIDDTGKRVSFDMPSRLDFEGSKESAENVCVALAGRKELIKYRVNKEGKISLIDTAADGGELKKVEYDGRSSLMMFRNRSGGFCEHKTLDGKWASGTFQYLINTSTKVFYITNKSIKYQVGSFSDFKDGQECVVDAYDMDEDGYCGAVVVDQTKTASVPIYQYNYLLFINKVAESYDSATDEVYYAVRGIFNGSEREYKINIEDFPNAGKIQSGDIIQFNEDNEGYLTSIVYVYAMNGNIPTGFERSAVYICEEDGFRGSVSDTAAVFVGKTVGRFGNTFKMEYMLSGEKRTGVFNGGAGIFIRYKDKKYTVENVRDIPAVCGENQYVLVHIRSGATFEVLVINKEV